MAGVFCIRFCNPMRAFHNAAIVVAFSAVLGGCGDSGPAQSPTASADVSGVVVSASDCASFGPGAVEACARAIESAVASHDTTAKAYTSIEECEAAVGERSCERSQTGHWKIRLSAFMVKLGANPRAEPLYPTKGKDAGFQSARKDIYLAKDRAVTFSRLAQSVAEMHAAGADTKRKRSSL
jgi:hypothetical protein